MSLSPLSPASPRKVCSLWHIFFALLAMNGPLPAELKFRENTVPAAPNSGSLILKAMDIIPFVAIFTNCFLVSYNITGICICRI